MLSEFSQEGFVEDLTITLSETSNPSKEQVSFIAKEIVQPLIKKLDSSEKMLWYSAQRQVILPGRFSPLDAAVTKLATKRFLKLFLFSTCRIYFVTKKNLVILSVIDWLENQKKQIYPLSKMEYMVVGEMYDPKRKAGNTAAFAYKTKDGHYDLAKIDRSSAEILNNLLTSPDFSKTHYQRLKDISVLEFVKMYPKQ